MQSIYSMETYAFGSKIDLIIFGVKPGFDYFVVKW